jgi:hypothetical protein
LLVDGDGHFTGVKNVQEGNVCDAIKVLKSVIPYTERVKLNNNIFSLSIRGL